MKSVLHRPVLVAFGVLLCLTAFTSQAAATPLEYYLRVDDTLTYDSRIPYNPPIESPYLPGQPLPGVYGSMTLDILGQGSELVTESELIDFSFFWITEEKCPGPDCTPWLNLNLVNGEIQSGVMNIFVSAVGGISASESNGVFSFFIDDINASHGFYIEGNLYFDPVPEPSTILLLGTGLVGLVGLRRKFRK